jgi:hypothetical protein
LSIVCDDRFDVESLDEELSTILYEMNHKSLSFMHSSDLLDQSPSILAFASERIALHSSKS